MSSHEKHVRNFKRNDDWEWLGRTEKELDRSLLESAVLRAIRTAGLHAVYRILHLLIKKQNW